MSKPVTGKIVNICELQEIGSNGFKKQEFWVEETADKYPQTICFQVTRDKIALLSEAEVGDEVTVQYNLRGRVWNDRCFNSLEAWSIRYEGQGSRQSASVEPLETRTGVEAGVDMDEQDSIPF